MADPDFARQSRERCAPAECDRREGCWVELGAAACVPDRTHCKACGGLIQIARWRPPRYREVVE